MRDYKYSETVSTSNGYPRKYKVGDIVRISDLLNHDPGYVGQVGVICNADALTYPVNSGLSDYYVVAYDRRAGRFWSCGFQEKEIESLGFEFTGLIDAYACWLRERCWSNTDPSSLKLFFDFMKDLKWIRKDHKRIVRERVCGSR